MGTGGMARGVVVVILADGWDRGEPAELAKEMGRHFRVAHKIVWANPLKASPGYAPLVRGMASPCRTLMSAWKGIRWLPWKP